MNGDNLPAVNTLKSHPAETGGGVAAAVALLLAHFLNITDTGTFAALVVVVGAVPAAITYVVNLVRKRNGTPAP